MKRSEAVLLIWNELVEPHFPDDSAKQADVILKKLEKRGMLPPEIKRPKDTFYWDYPNEWEPEDETK